MKVTVYAIIFVLTGISSFAQAPLKIKVFGSPIFSYRMVTGDSEFKSFMKDVHDPVMRYEGGVLVTVANRSRMDFETGLVLSRKGLSYGELNYRGVDNDPIGSVKIVQTSTFLEVPFRMNYYVSDERRNYFLAGISADFLLKSTFHYRLDGDLADEVYEEEPTGMRKFNTSLQVGYGFNLVKSEGFGLDLEPNFKIQLLDAYKESNSASIHFYTIGLACIFTVAN